jgi:hypothetical protein
VIELFPFEDAPKAHERMLSGDAHFRVVFDIATSGRRTRNPIARHKLRLWTTTRHQEWLENHAAAPLRRVTPPGYPQDIGKWRNNVIEHPAEVSVCLRRFCMGFESP